MINIAELLQDPDFTQVIQVNRRIKGFVQTGPAAGEVTTDTVLRTVRMCVQPIKDADDLNVLPEGQRSNKNMKFYAAEVLYCDDGDQPSGTGQAIFDTVVWSNEKYKLLHVRFWKDYGYWEAIGVNSERLS